MAAQANIKPAPSGFTTTANGKSSTCTTPKSSSLTQLAIRGTSNVARCQKLQMKKRLKIAAVVVPLFLAALTAFVVFDPYIVWFRKIPHARLTIDGAAEKGYLHRTTKGKFLFVTYTTLGQKETYSLFFRESNSTLIK